MNNEEIKLPLGPWDNEPQRKEWLHHDMPCIINRNEHMGYLCGYVGITESHPLYRKIYDKIDDLED